jgi:hypothetical protein
MPQYYLIVSCTAPANTLESDLRTSLLRLNARIVGADGPALIVRRILKIYTHHPAQFRYWVDDFPTDYGRRITVGSNIEIQMHEVVGAVRGLGNETKLINYKSLQS